MYSDNGMGVLQELAGTFVQQALRGAAKAAVRAGMPVAVKAACLVVKVAQASQMTEEADRYKSETASNAQKAAKGLEGRAGDAMLEAFEECGKVSGGGIKTGIDSVG